MNPFTDRPVGQPANDPPASEPAPGAAPADDFSAPRSKPSISIDFLPILGNAPLADADQIPNAPGTLSVQTTGAVQNRNFSETNPFKARLAAQSTGGSNATSSSFPQPPMVPSHFDLTPPEKTEQPLDGDPFAPISPPSLAQTVPTSQPPPPSAAAAAAAAAILSSSHDSRDSDKYIVTSSDVPPPRQPTAGSVFDSWDDVSQLDKPAAPPVPNKPAQDVHADDWNLIDLEPRSNSESNIPQIPVVTSESLTQPLSASFPGGQQVPSNITSASLHAPPAVPPRYRSPRPVDGSETYLVRKIRWQDRDHMRDSPILTQNANGPCPLVALVNALVISTPHGDSQKGIASVLLNKKSISLNTLLEAVIQELLEQDRAPDSPLPDIGDLMEFLKGLHTGMNVNPRFVPTPEQASAAKRTSLSHIHPIERDDKIPGGFEDSAEMRFYSTFSIPLVHGWIPARDSYEYVAMQRSAPSYEAAQILMSREEEMDEKLSGDGLSPQEQVEFEDLMAVKMFIAEWATQLTPTGLDIMTHALMPGQTCILFRNDHFSTLYRHPQTLELLSLVTDSGYATHDEVVWESLVDINGEQAEFFSGDFRVVSGRPSSSATGSLLIGPRSSSQNQTQTGAQASEQVDRDLALAMQLQEEENARQRSRQSRGGSGGSGNHDAARHRSAMPAINPRGVPLRSQQRRSGPLPQQQQSGVIQPDGSYASPYDQVRPPNYSHNGPVPNQYYDNRRDQYPGQSGGPRPGPGPGPGPGQGQGQQIGSGKKAKSRDCIVM